MNEITAKITTILNDRLTMGEGADQPHLGFDRFYIGNNYWLRNDVQNFSFTLVSLDPVTAVETTGDPMRFTFGGVV